MGASEPHASPAVDPDAFRAVMGRFATGVTVMTTVADGAPHGMTANAISSASLEPPLVLVCVERDTEMAVRVAASGVFALSFLTADQRELSTRFADGSRTFGAPEFIDVATVAAATGSPWLTGALAHVDCEVWATYDGGDHLIVVGEVVALDGDEAVGPGGEAALLYYRSGYHDL